MGRSVQDLIREDIFALTGLQDLDDEKKAEVFQKAYETIMNRILLRVADQIDENKLDEFKKILEENDSSAAQSFLTQNGVDIDQLTAEETLAYKAEMTSLTETLKSQSSSG